MLSSIDGMLGFFLGLIDSSTLQRRLIDSSQRLLGCCIRSAFCRLRSADSRRSAYLASIEGSPRTNGVCVRRDPRGLRFASCFSSMHVVCTQYAHSMYTVCTQCVRSMYACMLPNLSSYSILAA